jgi:hypothetical protein
VRAGRGEARGEEVVRLEILFAVRFRGIPV